MLLRPAAADDRLTIAASVARAARAPALEEMFFFGVHPGNFARGGRRSRISKSERALGVDLSLRWRTPRASGEVTYFRNDIDDYIFRRNMDHEEFEAASRRIRRRASADASPPDMPRTRVKARTARKGKRWPSWSSLAPTRCCRASNRTQTSS